MKLELWADRALPSATTRPSDPFSDWRPIPSGKSRIGEAVAYMHANIANENLDLERIVGICRLCRFQTTHAFQRVTRVTPAKFLYTLRTPRAKQLLAESRMNITEICFEVGYTGLGTFISRFNHLVGLSPSAYRHYVRGIPTFLCAAGLHRAGEAREAARPLRLRAGPDLLGPYLSWCVPFQHSGGSPCRVHAGG
jgi:AraC-like DNA-binding protein